MKIRNILFFTYSLFTISYSLSHAGWWNYDFETGLNKIAQHYAQCPPLKGKKIAVISFKSIENLDTVFGTAISEYMTNDLISLSQNSKVFTVLERSYIYEIEDEIYNYYIAGKVNISGINDKDINIDCKGADFLLIGTYDSQGDIIRISSRLIHVKKEECHESFTIKVNDNDHLKRLRKQRNFDSFEISKFVSCSNRSQGSDSIGIRLFKISNGKKIPFQEGEPAVFKISKDEMGFSIYLKESSWLNVIAIDGEGNAVFLYPVPNIKPSKFQGGQTYLFPNHLNKKLQEERYYEMAPPDGLAVLKVIATSADINFCEGIKPIAGNYFIDENALKDILSKLEILPKEGWSEKKIEFWIEP
ncbi:MAG: DUF4384 domain-containing protein [Desulfobacterales bacterium]|nr:DUF4384 domain-containing protein [Desulfobacterales bacterium]